MQHFHAVGASAPDPIPRHETVHEPELFRGDCTKSFRQPSQLRLQLPGKLLK